MLNIFTFSVEFLRIFSFGINDHSAVVVNSNIKQENKLHGCKAVTGVAPVMSHQPKVAILLAAYQGQRYLREQLDSFETQLHQNWEVWASDDHSFDDTHVILQHYQRKWEVDRLSLHLGPAEGFVANFLSLTCNASIVADYYAYADQDDIWKQDKLVRAVEFLASVPVETPALYCSRTRLIDEDDNVIGLSPLFTKPPSFANALMQNIGGGNTMVFNAAARALLKEAGEDISVVSHDWWAYMLISACGGKVFYDPTPTVRYRQHGSNLVGASSTWCARFGRIRMLWQGRFRSWNDIHIAALQQMQHKMTSQNRLILQQFVAARKMPLLKRLIFLKKSGIYRQTFMGNLGLAAAAIFGKL